MIITKFRNFFILTLITLLIWMSYEIYQISESTPTDIRVELSDSVDIDINTSALEKIPERFK